MNRVEKWGGKYQLNFVDFSDPFELHVTFLYETCIDFI